MKDIKEFKEELGVEYDEDVGLNLQAYSDLIPHDKKRGRGHSNNSEVARSAPPKPVQTSTNPKLSSDNGLQTPVKENGKGDPWEELSDALSAKKAQLAQANNGGWNKKGSSSGGSAWSYKALRGSGMGPRTLCNEQASKSSKRTRAVAAANKAATWLLLKPFRIRWMSRESKKQSRAERAKKKKTMAGGGVVRFGVKMIKMVLPVVKEVQSLGCEGSQGNQILLSKEEEEEEETKWSKMDEVMERICEAGDPFVLKATRSFFQRFFGNLFEKIWERVGGEDVRERIEQLREEYEKWRKEREEECEKWWKDAEEKKEKTEKEEEEAERDDIEEEEEEEETKWSKMDEVMERICEAGDPFVWGN
ncbi:hypothetical protein HID58_064625 [Brassica napus]|uniref:Uncharacterized protein n=1 Tax=Brassica napus TaxID=3708 RepID=A0ABQ7ZAI7_BRANA|nr:hypothetical protein HID58_064625 [Brassica napus]